MAKEIHDTVYDAALDLIATCVTCSVCKLQPANFAGIAAEMLAEITLTAGDGNGDWVIADAGGGGRQLTMSIQSNVDITTSGTATYVVWDTGATLLAATTCTSQVLTDTGTVTVPATIFTFADPT